MARALLAAVLATAVVAGCGEDSGTADDAIVTAYVEIPLCAEARAELARGGRGAGDVRVQVACLPRVGEDGKLDLAQIGANARRATEDSTSIAYLAAPNPAANRFSEPILEEADIPQLTNPSGTAAISRLLLAIEEAGEAGSLREAVGNELRGR